MEECKQSEAKYMPMENETIYKMWSISSSFRLADDKPVFSLYPVFILGISGGGEIYPPPQKKKFEIPPQKIPTEYCNLIQSR